MIKRELSVDMAPIHDKTEYMILPSYATNQQTPYARGYRIK